jgi:hypothetical protein
MTDREEFDRWFEDKYGWVSTRDPMAWQHKMACESWAWAAWQAARGIEQPKQTEDEE